MRRFACSSSSKQGGGVTPWISLRIKRYGQVKKRFSELKDQVCRRSCSFSSSVFSMVRLPVGTWNGAGAISRFTAF